MTEAELLAAISAAIFTNTGKNISGNTLRDLLLQMVGRLITGEGNSSLNDTNNTNVITGKYNSVNGTDNAVSGRNNVVTGNRQVVWGRGNIVNNPNNPNCNVSGFENQVSGCTSSAILGSQNVVTNCGESLVIGNGIAVSGVDVSLISRRLMLINMGNFADNASALAGGYKVGQLYRTGSQVFVVV